MKIKQSVKHWAAKQSLTAPVVGEMVADRLVDLHTGVFLDWAEEDRREERRQRLEAFFDATMDTYVMALEEGYPEAEAREITHAQANFDFYNHGWTEMMEFPVDEVETHYDRYAAFFEAHDITIDDPLGEFAPDSDSPTPPRPPRNSTIRSTPTLSVGSRTTSTSKPERERSSSAAARNPRRLLSRRLRASTARSSRTPTSDRDRARGLRTVSRRHAEGSLNPWGIGRMQVPLHVGSTIPTGRLA